MDRTQLLASNQKNVVERCWCFALISVLEFAAVAWRHLQCICTPMNANMLAFFSLARSTPLSLAHILPLVCHLMRKIELFSGGFTRTAGGRSVFDAIGENAFLVLFLCMLLSSRTEAFYVE